MARIRSIKPEFWVSEQIAECSTNARLTFIGLWTFSDDNGVHPAKPKTLKAELFPMDDVSASDVSAWIDELVRVGLLHEFTHEGEPFWHVTGWARHQKIDRPSFKYPSPTDPNSTPTPRSLPEHSTNTRRAPPPGVESKGVESKGVEKATSPKARPAPTKKLKTSIPADFAVSERVKAWAATKGFDDLETHLEAFKSKCSAKGYTNVDWDEAFMGAIREDWAKLRGDTPAAPNGRATARSFQDERADRLL